MESFISKQIISPILWLFIATVIISCTNETKDGPKKIYDDPIYEELKVTGENKSSFYLDGKVTSPERVEGYVKTKEGVKQYTLTCYTGSEGYFFDLFVPEGTDLVGEHPLSENGNRLIINHKADGLLTVYGTTFCNDEVGSIFIDAYQNNAISGHFTVKACNNGMIGEAGEKTIHKCKFNKVALRDL